LFLPLFGFIVLLLLAIPITITFVRNSVNNLRGSEIEYREFYETFKKGAYGIADFFRSYIPFIIIVAVYDSFTNRYIEGASKLTRVLVKKDLTFLLIRADELLLGNQAAYMLQDYITPSMNDLMYFGYALHFIFPFMLATYFYVLGKREYFRELTLSVVVISLIGYVGYLTFPSMSPVYVLSFQKDLDGGRMSEIVASEIAKVRSEQSDCCLFPSLHVGISAAVLFSAFKRDKKIFWILLPFVMLSWVSTVYLRRHFVVDIIAGWITAGIGVKVAPKIRERWCGTED
jgi:membrane-associated phospholipid phosphatase